MTKNMEAVALVCTVEASSAFSSSEVIARQALDDPGAHGVRGDVVRVVDHDVRPGVEADVGDGTNGR